MTETERTEAETQGTRSRAPLRRGLHSRGLPADWAELIAVVPLVEMVWADGRNQPDEVVLVERFLAQKMAELARESPPVTPDPAAVQRFLDDFVYRLADPEALRTLADLARRHLFASADGRTLQEIVDHCLDVSAAATVGEAAEGPGARITPNERHLLYDYLKRLQNGRAAPAPSAADRIGAYRILGELGSGGMGTVYLACRADDTFERHVAIKLLKRSRLDAASIERFRAERQILADLDHPNIARLLDGGSTPEGLPYLVMEYVADGLTLTEHIARHHVSLRRRLRLFIRVCEAVASAHTRLVIHRDIKPANILVRPDHEPKLVDFGIATILTEESSRATGDGFFLTPEYASPEQLRNEPVTTASDVYALGVVLFELVTGRRAPGVAPEQGLYARLQAALGRHLPAPSQALGPEADRRPRRSGYLRRRIRGDLDAIVRKATAADPRERYAGPAALASELERFLRGDPVKARRGTPTFRWRDRLRRHRGALVAATLGGVLTTWVAIDEHHQVVRLEAERDRALAEARAVEARLEAMAGWIAGGGLGPDWDHHLEAGLAPRVRALEGAPARGALLEAAAAVYEAAGDRGTARRLGREARYWRRRAELTDTQRQ